MKQGESQIQHSVSALMPLWHCTRVCGLSGDTSESTRKHLRFCSVLAASACKPLWKSSVCRRGKPTHPYCLSWECLSQKSTTLSSSERNLWRYCSNFSLLIAPSDNKICIIDASVSDCSSQRHYSTSALPWICPWGLHKHWKMTLTLKHWGNLVWITQDISQDQCPFSPCLFFFKKKKSLRRFYKQRWKTYCRPTINSFKT